MKLANSVMTLATVMGMLGAAVAGERETLTDEWFGYGPPLAEQGITISLGVTQVYQANVRNGLSTHRRSGRYAGSYDLEVELDTEALLSLPGGTLFILAEGSWSEGVDPASVGSLFGVNDDAGGDRSLDITELWYEQAWRDDTLRLRLGKLDLAGVFDANAYANDETGQFLNGALVNNPTIPFPDNGLGIIAWLQPAAGWYLAAGTADAHADARTTGFSTAFGGDRDFFSIIEAGFATQLASTRGELPGACRFGLWYDPQPKDRLDGRGARSGDAGGYLSLDQMVFRERDGGEQGLGLFARYGLADSALNEIKAFWSAGAQYRGLIPAREDDVLGLGVAQGRLSRAGGFTANHETAVELYYHAELTPWLGLSPALQYIRYPGGDRTVNNAVVAGIRLQLAF